VRILQLVERNYNNLGPFLFPTPDLFLVDLVVDVFFSIVSDNAAIAEAIDHPFPDDIVGVGWVAAIACNADKNAC
jgi:hypothetical protein